MVCLVPWQAGGDRPDRAQSPNRNVGKPFPSLLSSLLSLLSSLLVLSIGCASWDLPDPPVEDVAEKRKQRAEEAVQEFEKKRGFAEFQAALARYNRNDFQGCEEGLQQLLERNPKHRDARLLLAELYLAGNRLPEALSQVEQALKDHPADAQVHYTMGLTLDSTGQGAGALAYYERAAKLKPENELYATSYRTALEAPKDLLKNMVSLLENSPARQGGVAPIDVPDSSPSQLVVVSDLDAQDGEAAPRAAGYATPVSGAEHAARPSTSLQIFSDNRTVDRTADADRADHAVGVEKDPVRILIRKGRTALAAGSRQAALACFREAETLQPKNPQIPVSAAVAALRHNQPDLAIELLWPASQRFSDSVQVHRILGVAHYRVGDYHSSQVALQQALSLDKSSALSYFLMGCTLARLGHVESAQAHLRQARTIDPRYSVRR